ncbi:hypothetical protein [Myxosarcina sp. GI1]|uniref:hypothetical protein n=1 Tax=Myxosarcina sp. GI1 TaxID=1541065 RepID=UPI00056AFA0B|nr:hypothetical protein [Myxosarcina sp. GI1]
MTTIFQKSKSFLDKLLFDWFKFNLTKVHDLRKLERGVDYAVDFSEFYNSAVLSTALNIKVGEQVILSDREFTLRYCVRAVEYYWNHDCMREAKLERILLEQ